MTYVSAAMEWKSCGTAEQQDMTCTAVSLLAASWLAHSLAQIFEQLSKGDLSCRHIRVVGPIGPLPNV